MESDVNESDALERTDEGKVMMTLEELLETDDDPDDAVTEALSDDAVTEALPDDAVTEALPDETEPDALDDEVREAEVSTEPVALLDEVTTDPDDVIVLDVSLTVVVPETDEVSVAEDEEELITVGEDEPLDTSDVLALEGAELVTVADVASELEILVGGVAVDDTTDDADEMTDEMADDSDAMTEDRAEEADEMTDEMTEMGSVGVDDAAVAVLLDAELATLVGALEGLSEVAADDAVEDALEGKIGGIEMEMTAEDVLESVALVVDAVAADVGASVGVELADVGASVAGELDDAETSVGVELTTLESLVGVLVAESDVVVGFNAVLMSLPTELMADETALTMELTADGAALAIEPTSDVTADTTDERRLGSDDDVAAAEVSESEAAALDVIVAELAVALSVADEDELSVALVLAEALSVDDTLDELSVADALEDDAESDALEEALAESVELAEDESVLELDAESVEVTVAESTVEEVGVAFGSSNVEVGGSREVNGPPTSCTTLDTVSPRTPTSMDQHACSNERRQIGGICPDDAREEEHWAKTRQTTRSRPSGRCCQSAATAGGRRQQRPDSPRVSAVWKTSFPFPLHSIGLPSQTPGSTKLFIDHSPVPTMARATGGGIEHNKRGTTLTGDGVQKIISRDVLERPVHDNAVFVGQRTPDVRVSMGSFDRGGEQELERNTDEESKK